MATLAAYKSFDTRVIDAFLASTSALEIIRDSEITLTNSLDSANYAVFKGSFKEANAKGKYGNATSISFYETSTNAETGITTSTLTYTISAKFTLTRGTDGNLSWPDTDNYASSKLFAGNDKYFGSDQNDYISIYDIKGRDIYYGLGGNDYIELNTQGNCLAGGGSGNDLIVSASVQNRLTGGEGSDFLWLGNMPARITDFTAAEDKIVLLKSHFQQKLMTAWIGGEAPDYSAIFNIDDAGNYNCAADYFVLTEGIKKARSYMDSNDYFIYDLGTGKLYFDADALGKVQPKLVATYENQPLLTVEEIAGSIVFADHLEGYRSAWLTNYFI